MKAPAPAGWRISKLEDVIADGGIFIDGDWIESKDQDPAGDVRLVQLADIGDGYFRNKSNRFLTTTRAHELKCTFLIAGDLLIARMPDPLGRACIFPGDRRPCITVVDVSILRPESADIDSRLLMHFINSSKMRGRIDALQSGSTRKRISRKNLAGIEMPIPPIADQRRIVAKIEELFTQVDAGVQALDRAKALLKQYRQSLLKSAFSGKLTEQWREENRDNIEPASVTLERIRGERKKKLGNRYNDLHPLNGELPTLPHGWLWARLSEICQIKGGITKGEKRRAGQRTREVPYLRVANVQKGYLDLSEMKTIEATDVEIEQLRLLPNDVLFNEGGDRDKLGRGWVWSGELPECIHQNHVFRARLYDSSVPAKFVSYYGNSFGLEYFSAHGSQSVNLASINITSLGGLPIPFPSGVEQMQIVKALEQSLSVFSAIEKSIAQQTEHSQGLKRSVLGAAFSGRLCL